MEFSPWQLMTDLGLISLLLLVCTLLRAKVKFIQSLFLPASLLAGLLGLALGPEGVGLLPFSDQIGTYPGILIAIVFACLPMASPKVNWKAIGQRVGNMWAYSQTLMIGQWGIGVLFGLVVLGVIWPDLHSGFGILLASGFVGGHGTAAAVGEAFAGHGWPEAADLAMTAATVGVISAIVGGLIIIKFGTMKGYTGLLADFADLPEELRTGMVPADKRSSAGAETTSTISIDPLVYHFALVAVITLLANEIAGWVDALSIPVFALAFILGLVLIQIIERTPAEEYIDKRTLTRISGAATDLLVAFGVAAISIEVVVAYALPLALLLLFGILYCLFMFIFVAPRLFRTYWYEKAAFSWGWSTGTVAMAIALIRIVDPDLSSYTLDDFALAYVPIAPVEVAVVSFGPLMMVTGLEWAFVGATLGAGLLIMLFAWVRGWIRPNPLTNSSS